MENLLGEDLSLRHLPDLSDASMSFQIPTTFSADFELLKDDNDTFLAGTEDLLVTPAPKPTYPHVPLTLLPSRALSHAAKDVQKDAPIALRRSPRKTTRASSRPPFTAPFIASEEVPPSPGRFEELKDKFEDFMHGTVPMENNSFNLIPSTSQPTTVPLCETKGSLMLDTGATDKLMMCNTQFSNLDGVAPSDIPVSEPQQYQQSMTLADVTPKKTARTKVTKSLRVLPPLARPPSPIRRSIKRPAELSEFEAPAPKRGKVEKQEDVKSSRHPQSLGDPSHTAPHSHTKSETSSVSRPHSQREETQPSSRSKTRSRDGAAPSVHGRATRPKPSSIVRSGSVAGRVSASPSENLVRAGPSTEGRPDQMSRSTNSDSKSDKRLEARSEREKVLRPHNARMGTQTRTRTYHPVPDFKALHAAHDARLASRRKQIVPSVPVGIEFSTDSRMKERAKFDERVKEHERALEEEMEKKRRLREVEEEKEIKDMRKRMVVKAHEVPEWYKDAPKVKKGKR